jgi:hypothetical protein
MGPDITGGVLLGIGIVATVSVGLAVLWRALGAGSSHVTPVPSV